jgi:mannan endo-1,4-beta-mannosidase
MKNKYKLGGLVVVILALIVIVQSTAQSHPADGFHIHNGRLHDANGNEFIMRGVNHAHTWFTNQTSSFATIKNAGFDHTIVEDAPNWGPDWSFTMRNNAATVFNSDYVN